MASFHFFSYRNYNVHGGFFMLEVKKQKVQGKFVTSSFVNMFVL